MSHDPTHDPLGAPHDPTHDAHDPSLDPHPFGMLDSDAAHHGHDAGAVDHHGDHAHDPVFGHHDHDPGAIWGDVDADHAHDLGAVHGTPEVDMSHWHQQSGEDTCAIVSQQSVLEAYGIECNEQQLVDFSRDMGWYGDHWGTSLDDTGKLLEAAGIPCEHTQCDGIDDLVAQLDQGHHVLVAVDAAEYWDPHGAETLDATDAQILAGHCVSVIGINDDDPDHVKVILNDSGTPDGAGLEVPLDQFMNAWHDFGNFAVFTQDAPGAP